MKKKILFILIAVLMTVSFAACSAGKTDGNSAKDGGEKTLTPDIQGEVLDIQNENGLLILVDSVSDSVTGQVWVSVTDDTIFLDTNGEETQPEKAESLFIVGESASFLSTGVILESYPMQATANAVFVE